jgi:hypothetical protein
MLTRIVAGLHSIIAKGALGDRGQPASEYSLPGIPLTLEPFCCILYVHSSNPNLMSRHIVIDDGVGKMASSHGKATGTATGPGRRAIARSSGCGPRDGQPGQRPQGCTDGRHNDKGDEEVSVSGDQATDPPRIPGNPAKFGSNMQRPRAESREYGR